MVPETGNIENGNKKALLVFNPLAGAARKRRACAGDAMQALRAVGIQPELFLIETGCDLHSAVRNGLAEGCRLFVACGGDGTVSPVAALLAGTDGTLAILPAGTRNNIARSAGIPEGLDEAAAVVRDGRKAMVDVGIARCGNDEIAFLELCSVGLASALTPSGDAARHGELAGMKDFLWTLFSAEPSDILVSVDGDPAMRHKGHAVLVTNMPYTGLSFQLGPEGCQRDGLLNVTHFADLSKIDLLKYVSTGIHPGKREDPRICHRLAQTVGIETDPPMPVMVDGAVIGETPVHVEVRRRALAMMVP